MLIFDISPIYSNVSRVESFLTTLAYGLGLIGFIWLIPFILLQSFIRGFINPHKCFMHKTIQKILVSFKKSGEKENVCSKTTFFSFNIYINFIFNK